MTFPTSPDPLWTPLGSTQRDPWTYDQLERYMTGQQSLSFMNPEVVRSTQGRLRPLMVNFCRLVIDSLEELLDIEGFRLTTDSPADDALWGIWQANRLDVASQLCHLEALVHGRSYVLVWADETDLLHPRITVESSQQMAVGYDPSGTNITQAVKRWFEDDLAYATLYLSDSVMRFVADASQVQGLSFQTGDLLNTSSAWELREEPISHDLGQVPVVPFVNRPSLTRPFGESELVDVIPLVDAINKLGTDMMTSAEYHATPRRWITGVDMGSDSNAERARQAFLERWTQAPAGNVWSTDSDTAKMGQFPEASLENFVHAIELLTSQISALAGLTPRDFGIGGQGNPASADAIRAAETNRVRRAQRKQRVFGGSWEDVMRLAIIVRDGRPMPGGERMETIWRDPNTPTIAQRVDASVKLDSINMPFRQTLEDLQYTPTAIDRILSMQTSDLLANARLQLEAADKIVADYGLSRAAALAIVGLKEAAEIEAKVEARQPALEAEVEAPELGSPDAAVDPAMAGAAPA